MTRKEALYKVKGYLTDIIPEENYSEVEEIIKALEQEPCEDCISRQNAIDEIKALYEWHDTVTEDRAVDHLKRLPSAEPKTEDNTNANKIYNYLKEQIGDTVDDMKEFDAWFERMVWHVKECNRLTAEPKTGWIPVSEGLPREGQVVLAIGDKGTWDVGKFQGTAGWTSDERMWDWKKKTVKYVEYWMPKDAIPLPYRKDGE